jgi:proteasome beta subunit
MDGKLKTGTTTVGITCKEGVVMGTEHRATMGNFIAHKTTQKLYKIDENLALAVAGLVGDAQTLQRYLVAEVELYKLKQDLPMSVRAASTLMANILSGHRYYPYWVQLLIGGVDNTGNYVYSLDAAGGVIPDKYVSAGSGSVFVYGVLEDYYKDNVSLTDATDICIRGITAAMKRDSASGDGIEICQITKKGYKEIPEVEIKKRQKKLDIE